MSVSTRSTATDLALSVHNLGEPIPPELMALIFEPFTRGGRAETSSPRRNLGIGLFIVRHVVLAHGGTIEVSSSAAEGTRFVVRLPR